MYNNKYAVLIIDPWGIKNLANYTNGLCNSLSKFCNLTLVTNYHSNIISDEFKVLKFFFKRSEVSNCIFRRIIRGLEYIFALYRIYKLIKKSKFDIVHIQWFLLYKIDNIFLSLLKHKVKSIVYTAHNVLPHINPIKYKNIMSKIYDKTNVILVHGENSLNKISQLFPNTIDKLRIQRHGVYFQQNVSFSMDRVDGAIIDIVNKYDKVFIYNGYIFYDKGVDRIIKIWLENVVFDKSLLIIAGKITELYPDLITLNKMIETKENILYLPRFIDEDTLNYMISKSSIMLLPYRNASMSGVVFTAANHKIPILITKVGDLVEYLSIENSFIVDNDDVELKNKLVEIVNYYDFSNLKSMGLNFCNEIFKNYSWDVIGSQLENIYNHEVLK